MNVAQASYSLCGSQSVFVDPGVGEQVGRLYTPLLSLFSICDGGSSISCGVLVAYKGLLATASSH